MLIDPDTCEYKVFQKKTVVETVENPVEEISIVNAIMIDSKYEEGDIKLAEIWGLNDKPVLDADDKPRLLNLREMYWLNIPPVSNEGGFENSDWIFKGGMGSGAAPWEEETKVYGLITNLRVAVTMMISNRYDNMAHAPNMLR